jgi:hypothetical protein
VPVAAPGAGTPADALKDALDKATADPAAASPLKDAAAAAAEKKKLLDMLKQAAGDAPKG